MEPKLTVLLLAYNDEKTITPALESILEQELWKRDDNFELIVLPNGCKDKTVDRINDFFKKNKLPANIKYQVVVIPEGHRNKTLNTGVKKANGKYICYMNADCTFSKHGLTAIVDLFESDNKVQIASLNDIPNLEHLPKDSLLRGFFEVQLALGEIRGRIVPVGRALAFRKGLIESFPENIHSEDNWISFITAEKYGLESVRVIQTEFAYWTPPSDWATFINLMARYFRGTSQLFEKVPETEAALKKLQSQIKRVPPQDLREEVVKNLIQKGKMRERAEELFDFYLNVVKIFPEQEKIIGRNLINEGKWVTDR